MADFLKLKKSNCKNCYKCIRHCPVKSIRFSGNQAHIIGNECILCGQCFVVCPQNAKEIADATEQAKVLIASGSPVYVSLAPSFISNYNGIGIEAMRSALKKLGFADVEETAIGATIVKNEYERMIDEDNRNIIITSCCHSINLLIQKYFPHLLHCIADVVSPMQAHCIDIKKRYPNAKTIFIGPCLAKKDEADHYAGIVDAVLTFEELTKWLSEEDIELVPSENDLRTAKNEDTVGKTRFFPTTGGILKSMNCNNPKYTYLAIDGVDNCVSALHDIENGLLDNCFIEMSACVGSCIGGPVMEKYHRSPVRDYISVASYAGNKDFEVEQPTPMELHKNLESIEKKLKVPTDEEIAIILKQMGKNKPQDFLNCGSCGYNTCRDKAIAIYQGKADISTCMPYLMAKAESFSDTIINNTPNGIIVLNDNLEVQQINRSALKMFNLSKVSDVMGEPVVRILDPGVFIKAKTSSKKIILNRVYLAEYNSYVEQTVVYDKDYKLIICIMRDVTEEENERNKKEKVSRHTVEIADKVVEKQMRIVQEIASLLGETAAETKIALTKLKESIEDE